MVLMCYIVFVTLISSFKLCICQRKISHGRFSTEGKSFMVYLLPSPYTEDPPDSWLCGGAIITATRVLTAAACLLDVDHTYVIAGYKKYVRARDLEHDECTRLKKQKIVKIVVPKAYNLTNWMKLDVGVAVVEKPYNFLDVSYRVICSYPPSSIKLNYGGKYEEPSKSAIAYGWGGHNARKPGQTVDINSRYLKEARTLITTTAKCQNKIDVKMETYFLCAYGAGYLISDGRDVLPEGPKLYRRNDFTDKNNTKCLEENESLKCDQSGPAFNEMLNQYTNSTNKTETNGNYTNTRRQDFSQNDASGACQNDHGGALVSWIGKLEYLLGIAITSILNAKYECEGPFLYTSIAQNAVLVDCLLAISSESKESKCQIVERLVEWPDTRKNTGQGIIKRRQQPLSQGGQLLEKQPRYSVRFRPQVQLGNEYTNADTSK